MQFMNVFAKLNFYLIFFVTMFYFMWYKMSDNVSLLLPSVEPEPGETDVYSVLRAMLFILLVFKTLHILYSVIQQATCDVIMIDWEKPRRSHNADENEVVAWRQIFISNEFNELQAEKRIIYPVTLLIWFGLFWVGLGYGNIAQTNPDITRLRNSLQPHNMFLQIFLASFLFIVIAFVLWLLDWISHWRIFQNPRLVTQFTDLCSVANISVLFMTSKIHGHYIHGKAPWDYSDVPISWLKMQLDKERLGKFEARSLPAQYIKEQHQQGREYSEVVTTYEVFFSRYCKEKFQQFMDLLSLEYQQIQADQQTTASVDPNLSKASSKNARKDS